jgi:hypothetical protein
MNTRISKGRTRADKIDKRKVGRDRVNYGKGVAIIAAGIHTAKTKCRKFETNIPRKGISGPQSQFPHSCVCERIIYSHDGSACSAGGNM